MRQLLSNVSSMNHYPAKDIELLRKMVSNLDMFQAKLSDNQLPHHERQIIEAAILELKSHIERKARDVKRRLREKCDY